CVERVQRTILEECWRPTFARSLVPKYTALRRDLDEYLRYYNWERGHSGRRSSGSLLPSWSMVPARCAHDDRHLSGHLGGRSA
ncbi:MAG TPA: hypothetical protein VG245_11240, partial [Candidatus Dormibacteraeota bacterium]|nr:hypothetical protein [Candidatus Dormibacteraeota bacterium]